MRPEASPRHSPAVDGILAGLFIGVAASAVFALLAVRPALALLAHGLPDGTLIPLVLALTFGGAARFAYLVARGRGEPGRWSSTLIVGISLPLAGVAGLFGAGSLEPLGLAQPNATLVWVFRLAFMGASAGVAFVCTLVAWRVFGLRGGVAEALVVAAVTAGTHLLVALALDPVPGFHVGGGDRAMPKVAALCNLAAGSIGGTTAFRLLTRARSPGHAGTGPSRASSTG
jgi:hypothetical protein